MAIKPLNADLLFEAAKDAKKRGQYGLLIWPNEAKWRTVRRLVDITDLEIGKIADFLNNGQMCWVSFGKEDVKLSQSPKDGYALAVPTSKILSDANYRREVLGHYPQGVATPISIIPAMILSVIHLNSSLSKS